LLASATVTDAVELLPDVMRLSNASRISTRTAGVMGCATSTLLGQ
jgi:hypothetical protein